MFRCTPVPSSIRVVTAAATEALAVRRRELQTQPERYIAQEVIALSTHPTFDGETVHPRAVDLRAFVHLVASGSSVSAEVAPALLTRVAPIGSAVVDRSRVGGTKDMWILDA